MLDTSVAVKWYVSEEFRDEALTLFDAMANGTIRGAAPSTIQPEFWNALWQKRRRGELSPEEARSIWGEFAEDPVSLYKPEDLMPRATEIADFGVIIYDALFISLAEAMDTIMATADDRLLRPLRETPFADLVRHIKSVDEFVKTV
ncbi:MAG: type II toxin-antitoxin system VapC family toxin [Rubrobacter sp.]|nr:type II toxin-antitoxin system VapC family toxin [Rubrobacter sp.]